METLLEMSVEDFVCALRLFNQKIDKLSNYSFVHNALRGTSSSISWKETDKGLGVITKERIGPSKETIDAFVLTFRFFIQDNEACSLRNLSALYRESPVSDTLKNDFENIRTKINNFLDSGPQMGIMFLGEKLTYRKIMYTIIYGDLAHASAREKDKFEMWMDSPLSPFIENSFVSLLVVLFKTVNSIKKINLKTIEKIITLQPI